MIDIAKWLKDFEDRLTALYGSRLVFFGIQGSYARGEATDTSDIDVVVLLDKLEMADLERYRRMLAEVEHKELVCGFVGGVQELAAWEAGELFQFCHDTAPVIGSLEQIMARLPADAARRSVLAGACAIYHGCSHNYLHGRSVDVLKELYKGALFVLRAKHYCESGEFVKNSKELAAVLKGADCDILRLRQGFIYEGLVVDLEEHTPALLLWAQKIISCGTDENL